MVGNKSATPARERVCPVCSQKFMGRAAMRSHLLAKHPTFGASTPKATAQPKPGPSRKRQTASASGSSSRLVQGKDILASVGLNAAGTSVGMKVFTADLQPKLFAGTRMSQEASLWGRWRPADLAVQVRSSAPAVSGGMYMTAWNADTGISLPSGINAVKTLASWPRSAENHISTNISFRIPCDSSRKWYTFDGSLSDQAHGTFVILISAPVTNLTGTIQLSVHLEWKIHFDSPNLPPFVVPGNDVVYADEAYTPYFTDSSSDWQSGKKLTFKHAAGGSIVPFPRLEVNKYYKSTVPISYVQTNGTVKSAILCGAMAVDYTGYPIMALFSTEADAKAYAKAPASLASKIMNYQAAGGWVSPANQAWSVHDASPDALVSFKAAAVEPQMTRGDYETALSLLLNRVAHLENRLGEASSVTSSVEVVDPEYFDVDAPPGNAMPPLP